MRASGLRRSLLAPALALAVTAPGDPAVTLTVSVPSAPTLTPPIVSWFDMPSAPTLGTAGTEGA